MASPENFVERNPLSGPDFIDRTFGGERLAKCAQRRNFARFGRVILYSVGTILKSRKTRQLHGRQRTADFCPRVTGIRIARYAIRERVL